MHLRKSSRKRRGAMVILMAVVMILLFIGLSLVSIRPTCTWSEPSCVPLLTLQPELGPARCHARKMRDQPRLPLLPTQPRILVAGKGLTIRSNQITLGTIRAAGQKIDFVPDDNPLVAVRVQGSRDNSSPDGDVTLFFGQLLNVSRFQPRITSTSAANVRDVALVLDISGSMGARLGSGTRISALKDAVNVFLDQLTSRVLSLKFP